MICFLISILALFLTCLSFLSLSLFFLFLFLFLSLPSAAPGVLAYRHAQGQAVVLVRLSLHVAGAARTAHGSVARHSHSSCLAHTRCRRRPVCCCNLCCCDSRGLDGNACVYVRIHNVVRMRRCQTEYKNQRYKNEQKKNQVNETILASFGIYSSDGHPHSHD